MKKSIVLFTLILLSVLGAQGEYEGPTDPAADPAAIREARMNGNRILLYFKNTT